MFQTGQTARLFILKSLLNEVHFSKTKVSAIAVVVVFRCKVQPVAIFKFTVDSPQLVKCNRCLVHLIQTVALWAFFLK